MCTLSCRNPVKLNEVSWSCEAPIGNIVDNSVGCHDNLLILFDRFVELAGVLFTNKLSKLSQLLKML